LPRATKVLRRNATLPVHLIIAFFLSSQLKEHEMEIRQMKEDYPDFIAMQKQCNIRPRMCNIYNVCQINELGIAFG